MKKQLLSILVAIVMVFGTMGIAQATTWIDSNSITSGGEGSVGYSYFTLDAYSSTVVQTHTDNFDPYLYLFFDDGSLDSADVIAYDDDSGEPSAYGYRNSLISIGLAAGSYIAAVSDFSLSLVDAISGINTNIGSLGIGFGSYTLEVNASTANVTATAPEAAPVPEPSTMLLLGSGIIGLVLYRRKRK